MDSMFGNEFLRESLWQECTNNFVLTWESAGNCFPSSFLFGVFLNLTLISVLGKVTFKSNALQYCVTP